MPTTPATFGDFPTVRRYAASLADRTPAERGVRLATLQEFSAFVERTPDEMVEEIYDPVAHKYRKRGFYRDRINTFAAQGPGSRAEQRARGNVIRAFFIANGVRVPPEAPEWMGAAAR